MKKYLFFLSFSMFILLCTACSTLNTSGEIVKLTPSEQNNLVSAAQSTLLRIPDSKLLKAEKKFIKENPPTFKPRYKGNKKGDYTIRWEIPTGKTLLVIGKGNMLDFRDSFEKISVVSINVNKPVKK